MIDLADTPKQIENRKKNRNKNVNRERAGSAIDAHRRKGHITLITKSELKVMFDKTTQCPICGKEFSSEYGVGKILNSSPSLDRINNELELRPDNVWVICSECNRTKGQRTMKEFYDYCKMIHILFEEIYD